MRAAAVAATLDLNPVPVLGSPARRAIEREDDP